MPLPHVFLHFFNVMQNLLVVLFHLNLAKGMLGINDMDT